MVLKTRFKIFCSYFQTHLPGYVQDADKIKARGIDEIVCVSVNDAFVMNAWAEANGTKGKVCVL